MNEQIYRIGIDVGSTTVKTVVMNEGGKLVFSAYERHNAKVKEVLTGHLHAAAKQIGEQAKAVVCVTGSVGMAVSELLSEKSSDNGKKPSKTPFVQEVVAATTYLRQMHPEVQTLIDIGGEDSKIVLRRQAGADANTAGKQTGAEGHSAPSSRMEHSSFELRMNGNCAGGTGSFIDQMAVLLGVSNQQLSDMALKSEHEVTIAARCGVFAKTDVQNLISRNVPRNDIAMAVFHSIAVQTVTTLAHGCTIQTPVMLIGGPLTYLPALRKAFAKYMHWQESDLIYSDKSNLVPAMGCALKVDSLWRSAEDDERSNSDLQPLSISEIFGRLNKEIPVKGDNGLEPLFASKEEWQAWRKRKERYNVEVKQMNSHEDITIGIDSGSTTTKIIAMRPNGEILYSFYAPSKGNPIGVAAAGLKQLKEKAEQEGCELRVVGSCSTGYGEELIKAALSFDNGIIETMAHYQAARRLMPDVSFILDIGGQDMKAVFIEGGVIKRMELNEACSSGCGTFIQTFAQSLGYDVEEFSKMACTAPHPSDLGTRCTVFMNSKIKQVLREGASAADISAGLAYSVVSNCLNKVLKLSNTKELGKRIVVQGGTMRNDAVVRALEKLTETEVARSSMPEMMGAYGCALYAAGKIGKGAEVAARSIDDLLAVADYESKELRCKGCENQCAVLRYRFRSGKVYYSGNKCERVFSNSGKDVRKGLNIYPLKYQLLFDRPILEGARRSIGIPRVLNMYEEYPFWHRLLTDCGFRVVLSSPSRMKPYEAALCHVMSDNICFPAKLVHSHIAELAHSGVERILMPYTVFERKDSATAVNSYNCPIVSGYSDVVRSSQATDVSIDSPVVNFSDNTLLWKQIKKYMKGLGVGANTIKKAFRAALDAQHDFEVAVRDKNIEIYKDSCCRGVLTILLAGRPYHADDFVQHRLGEMLSALGVNVISDDIVRLSPYMSDGDTLGVRQWAFPNRIIKAAQWVGETALGKHSPAETANGSLETANGRFEAQNGATIGNPDVEFVEMTSFGCGPDAFIQDEVRALLHRYDKTLTLLKIDDVQNLGSLRLRVRSLIESIREQAATRKSGAENTIKAVPPISLPKAEDMKERPTVLVPFISEYVSDLLQAFADLNGYNMQVLPMGDEESARLGLKYSNNEVCYPATLIVGDFIKALQSGRYDLNKVAVGITQTGGQCRATNYAGLIKRALIESGFQQVPVITVGVTTHSQQGGSQFFHINWRKMAPILLSALLYADTMAKMYYGALPRELSPGLSEALRDKYLRRGADCVRNNDVKGLMRCVSDAAEEFDLITRERQTDKVGIVGEIFLKFHHFAHQEVIHQLTNKGLEVLPPLISSFFIQEFVNIIGNRRMGLRKGGTNPLLVHLLYAMVKHRIRKINRLASRFKAWRPFTDIFDQAKGAKGIVKGAAQFGEGWLLPAEIVEMAEGGVNNVVSLQPFGCIANHIIAKGVANAIRRRFPNINYLTLDFDSGVSRTNVTNRLLLFMEQAHSSDNVRDARNNAPRH